MSKDKGWHYSGDRDYLSYGGYWWRKTGDREVTVIRIENLDEDSDKDLEKCRFEIDQLTIDLDDSDVADALRTVGWYDENPGKNWKKSSTDDRVNAMVAHWGSQLRSGGDDVVHVRGDEAAEKTLEQWKSGVEPTVAEQLPAKPYKKPLYGAIASTLDALKMSEERGNTEWAINHRRTLKKLEGHLPSGSGVDNGTKLDHDKSTDKKLVFDCSFHHMNELGFYDGWTEHTVTVTPNFDGGVDVKVSGRDRNGVKDDIAERFRFLAGEDVEL